MSPDNECSINCRSQAMSRPFDQSFGATATSIILRSSYSKTKGFAVALIQSLMIYMSVPYRSGHCC